MSFHKRKKKQTKSTVVSPPEENPISFDTTEENVNKQIHILNSPPSELNGGFQMACDNNNKENTGLANTENCQNKISSNGEHEQNKSLSHNTETCNSSSSNKTSNTSSTRRKFIVLTRFFIPWKWRRKKKADKSLKGKI